MFFSYLLACGKFAGLARAEYYPEYELDEPMLRGPPRTSSSAMLRFGCSQVVIERLDPLVEPGATPSSHMHQVVGGNAFAASMPTTDIAKLGSCTTCHFEEDLSNYWTANLYFKAGFRMLSGDSTKRESDNLRNKTQQCYRCYTAENWGGSMYSPCMDPELDTDHFPNQQCVGGIRSNIIFPQYGLCLCLRSYPGFMVYNNWVCAKEVLRSQLQGVPRMNQPVADAFSDPGTVTAVRTPSSEKHAVVKRTQNV
ncbi:hypothetical protein MYCTH_2297192 [Thermothelomyces thermophilus ATCC 42464]|uniref:DUF1996 domain-containing protein n=1 Tax=Thermothelomyces thermophilus (strain ATCC 42464 / BCRC 31852 / DSM 1799) TaxID=573729 RepID=G2Q4P3_THET4|nr:uncharacterized protein MYCTH_2297192 [Thermothelomyces thermophilus ATCC 42464]AEO54532.1 hypothetical protein MYCTH_2297192 [Thermothelomyces thermophilus ATCC 42464]